MTLRKHLTGYGWNPEDAANVASRYFSGGIHFAIESVKWMDDEDHDYSGEMHACIQEWERSEAALVSTEYVLK